MIRFVLLDTELQGSHFVEPSVIFQMFVFVTKVRGYLVRAFGGKVT